jgi:hypothetical protein
MADDLIRVGNPAQVFIPASLLRRVLLSCSGEPDFVNTQTKHRQWHFTVFPAAGLLLGLLLGLAVFLMAMRAFGAATVGLATASPDAQAALLIQQTGSRIYGMLFLTYCAPPLLPIVLTLGGYLLARRLNPKPAPVSPQDEIEAVLAKARKDE